MALKVKGHPNCDWGDCNKECHVVGCQIYQGYEEAEPYDDDEPKNVEKTEKAKTES